MITSGITRYKAHSTADPLAEKPGKFAIIDFESDLCLEIYDATPVEMRNFILEEMARQTGIKKPSKQTAIAATNYLYPISRQAQIDSLL